MAIVEIYSKRQKALRGDVPDIFTYDIFPQELKQQIVYILNDAFGESRYESEFDPESLYKFTYDSLSREYGKSLRVNSHANTYKHIINSYLLLQVDANKILDVVEFCFRLINTIIRNEFAEYLGNNLVRASPDEAIEELNHRFKEHGIGYQFENNEIIRIDSTYIHAQVVKPALNLLSSKVFLGANEEYLKAHEHYRHGRNKECLVDCLKAFESTLKTICKAKGWVYNETDTSKKLIQILFANNFVPTFTQNQFTSLQNLIESGIPTVRNKTSGHGQGQVPVPVSDEMTRYGLNLTGTNIIFLVEQSGIQ